MIIKRERKKLETEKAIIQTEENQKSHAVEQFSRETERENGIIGKKVKVSLRLFDIFERNMVFIFL